MDLCPQRKLPMSRFVPPFLLAAGFLPVLLLASCYTLGVPHHPAVPHTASLDADIEAIRSLYGIPALGAYATFADGTVEIAVAGVRKYGEQTPARTADQFHFASNGKAMTATLVAMFVEEGRLRWDEPVTELFPGLVIHPEFRGVTLAMLLTHRSGLTTDMIGFEGGRLWSDLHSANLTPVAGRLLVAQRMLAEPPAYEPGKRFEYANAGYVLIGAVLERLAGLPYEQLLQQRLWEPLGMSKSCGFGAPGHAEAAIPDEPWGHHTGWFSPQPQPPGPQADNPPALSPAGRMHCAMADWAKFLDLHLKGERGEKTRMLTPASFKKLHTAFAGDTYTYGAWIIARPAWTHGIVLAHEGDNTLNHALVALLPEEKAVVITVANIGGDRGRLATLDAFTRLRYTAVKKAR